jgi:radical SAM protein with 4Fe4S-binding SPASM domain
VDALVLNVFFLVCTGRGEKVTNISPDTYEAVLRRVTQAAHDIDDLMVRAKCAPHFKRMAIELDPEWPITLAHGYDAGGCLAGTRYCRVTPEGDVTACPYIGVPVGSIRQQAFAEIWRGAPMFRALREPRLEGRCGACEYRVLCGGCRARPLARDGNLMGEDFLCAYQPGGAAVIQPLRETAVGLDWTANAEGRLNHVPPFVRRMVRRRAEDYVRDQGRDTVTAEDLKALLRRRFGEDGLPLFLRDRISTGFGDGS